MTIFNGEKCPHCGQSMKGSMFGVFLTPARYRILAYIHKHPGVTRERLGIALYKRSDKAVLKTISSTITHINAMLAETEYLIRGPGIGRFGGGYRIIKGDYK